MNRTPRDVAASLGLLASILVMTSCAPGSAIRESLDAQFDRAGAAGLSELSINLSDVVDGDWTSVALLCHGVTEEEDRAVLGPAWPGGPNTESPNFFGAIVFLRDDRVVDYHSLDFEDQTLDFTYCTPAAHGRGVNAIALSRDEAVVNFTLDEVTFGNPTWYTSQEEADRLLGVASVGFREH